MTFYAWIKKFTPVELDDGSSIMPDDYAKLQQEMHKLQEEDHSIQTMCETLDVPRSTYYQSLNHRSLIVKKY